MALESLGRNVEPLPRYELEQFLKNFRQIKAFEQLQLDGDEVVKMINVIIETLNAVLAAPIVTASTVAILEDERILQGDGQAISATFGPASAVISLDDTAVIPATYGSESETAAFTVDQQGRLTHAEAFSLNTDNIAEGTANLYFTQARARESLSAGNGINYDNSTGIISCDIEISEIIGASPAADGTYLAPTSITITDGVITAIS